jgi:hypothetical protein
MQVILLERVEHLGAIGDEVTVKDGYARNFLLPKHKALVAKLLPDVIQRADEITEFLAIYWATNEPPPPPSPSETDVTALAAGHVTLTPLDYDLTHRAGLDTLAEGPWSLR